MYSNKTKQKKTSSPENWSLGFLHFQQLFPIWGSICFKKKFIIFFLFPFVNMSRKQSARLLCTRPPASWRSGQNWAFLLDSVPFLFAQGRGSGPAKWAFVALSSVATQGAMLEVPVHRLFGRLNCPLLCRRTQLRGGLLGPAPFPALACALCQGPVHKS